MAKPRINPRLVETVEEVLAYPEVLTATELANTPNPSIDVAALSELVTAFCAAAALEYPPPCKSLETRIEPVLILLNLNTSSHFLSPARKAAGNTEHNPA